MKWTGPWAGRRRSPATERSRLQMRAGKGLQGAMAAYPLAHRRSLPHKSSGHPLPPPPPSPLIDLGPALCPRIRFSGWPLITLGFCPRASDVETERLECRERQRDRGTESEGEREGESRKNSTRARYRRGRESMKCQTQPEKQPPRKRPLWHIHGPTTTRGPRPQIPVLLGPEPVVREAPATPKAVSFQPIIPDPPSASRPSEPSLLRERTVSEPCCHGLGYTSRPLD
jgi:hypothetical protein